jgi:hypothetical protein
MIQTSYEIDPSAWSLPGDDLVTDEADVPPQFRFHDSLLFFCP